MPTKESSRPGNSQSSRDPKDKQSQRHGQQPGGDESDDRADTRDRSGNRGNFANDPERAREAGQKGGQSR